MTNTILSIDLGTTALKAAIFDYAGAMLADSAVEYSLITKKTSWVEADPGVYLKSIKIALEQLKQKADLMDIRAIGFSAQGETLFFVDKNGEPLRNAIVWMDNRASEEAELLKECFGDELCYEVTGQVSFESCWPAPKILWVRNNEPKVFAETRKILLIEDYIINIFTNKYVTEGSLLTSTEYWDIRTKRYWPEMLEKLGICESQLPEILESGVPVGRILPDIARELGISPEAVVCTGCLDQAAGAIGVGNISPGIFSETVGAALAVCVPTARLTYDPARLMPVHYFAVPDTYMMHTFTTGGMTLRWFRDTFCAEEMAVASHIGRDSYDLLSQAAETVSAGSDGLIMLPHLNGSMAPDMNANAKGVYYGFTMKHRKEHFIRAIMESIGYIVRRNLEVLSSMGIEVNQIRSLGGGSRSDIWCQIKADITGRELIVMDTKEAPSLGAAILAGRAIGVFGSLEEACQEMIHPKKTYIPNPENRDIYDKLYEDYKKLFGDLTEMFER